MVERFQGATSLEAISTKLELIHADGARPIRRGCDVEPGGPEAYRRKYDDKSPLVNRARFLLGDALRGQGRFAQAEPLLLASYSALSGGSALGLSRAWSRNALQALVRLYDAEGEPKPPNTDRGLVAEPAPRPPGSDRGSTGTFSGWTGRGTGAMLTASLPQSYEPLLHGVRGRDRGLRRASAGAQTRMLRTPTVSETQIAFAYANNIWIVDRAGGAARRLTSFQGDDGESEVLARRQADRVQRASTAATSTSTSCPPRAASRSA